MCHSEAVNVLCPFLALIADATSMDVRAAILRSLLSDSSEKHQRPDTDSFRVRMRASLKVRWENTRHLISRVPPKGAKVARMSRRLNQKSS